MTVANVDYALCPDVTLDEIVAQMRACLAFVHAHAREWDCDSGAPVRRRPLGGGASDGHAAGGPGLCGAGSRARTA